MALLRNLPSFSSVALCLAFSLSACKGKKGNEPAPDEAPAKESQRTERNKWSEWLPRHRFNAFVMERSEPGDDGKTFWQRGHCIEAIEGRWADGYQQYRVVIGKVPREKRLHWTWFFDMEKEFFQKKLTQLGMEGYRLVSIAHNTTPSGSDSFAAVWHKITDARPPEKPAETPAQKPGKQPEKQPE